ncbi:DUF1294 domain-containing protein [Alkalicoccus daliensis]|uniref:Uncharacterized membrane protein YsdA, DUF1294 family n=1 Tax=Alkalicoccus daliensis TaxID=745820 RepID=A0A1H0CF31_9BACI|nr:DUF1294 domain-containing protein [Alkalicoccus daliensis]SDN56401.1 Uncharacterized membrane protein YsdA, DUF1294 family [Alkalicoccus daliensis]
MGWIILWAALNIYGGILFVFDKRRAVKGGRRVSEKSLLTWAAFGAAPAMWFASKAVRHKTRVKKFVIMLPLFICMQAAAVLIILWQLGLLAV